MFQVYACITQSTTSLVILAGLIGFLASYTAYSLVAALPKRTLRPPVVDRRGRLRHRCESGPRISSLCWPIGRIFPPATT